MRRLTQYLVIVYFLGFISVPLAMMALGYEPAAIENKDLVDFPEFQTARVLDQTSYSGIAAALRERIAVRPEAIALEARVDLAFGDSPSPEVAIGSDGWLFLSKTVEVECVSEADARLIADRVGFLQHAYAKAGQRLLFVVAPDKASVYPQHLGGLANNPCIRENVVRWEQAFANHGPDMILLWDAMADTAATDEIYYQKDTHWNVRGAAVAARAVVEALVPGMWSSEDISFAGSSRFVADLTALMGVPTEIDAPIVSLDRAGVVQSVTAERMEMPAAPIIRVTAQAPPGTALVPGTTVLVHDSFGGAFIETVLQDFERLIAVGSFQFGYEAVATEIAEADTVVIMTVERELVARLGGSNWTELLAPVLSEVTGERIDMAKFAEGAVGPLSINDDGALESGSSRPMAFPVIGLIDDGRQFLVITGVASEVTAIHAYWDPVGQYTPDRSSGIRVPANTPFTVVLDITEATVGSELRVDLGANMVVSDIRVTDFRWAD